MEPVPEVADEVGRREVVIDAGYAGRLLRSQFRARLFRTAPLWVLVGYLVLATPVLPSVVESGHSVVMYVVFPVLFVLFFGWQYAAAFQSLRRQFPPGSVMWSRFDSEGLTIGAPHGASSTRYSALRSPVRRGEFVELRAQPSGRRIVYPSALIPESEYGRFR